MRLYIQDPTDKNAPVLQEKILEICEKATSGAGAFAFVTSEGVDLLLKDAVFKDFATKGTFDLIVGVDEVTNTRALNSLAKVARDIPGLTVRVFYNTLTQSVFHPKFCWFRHRTKAFVLAGSGNLTARGLRGNWEAFGIEELDLSEADALEAQWNSWLAMHTSRLRGLEDSDVVARAAENFRRRAARKPTEAPEEEQREAEPPPLAVPSPLRVLIAEIPRASTRWNQANFDLESFRNFFGARPGAVQRVVLQHVDASGTLESIENRPSVSVRSRNFRFELEAASGLPYPAAGRPIAVFVEIAPRTFRYRLLMPSDSQHRIVNDLLTSMWSGPNRRVRRKITDTDTLRHAWPNSPLFMRPLEIEE